MIDLDAIKGRLAAAAPGPWKPMIVRRSIDGNCVALVQADAPNCIVATIIPQYSERETIPLLVAARADMDALVAEVERLRAERHLDNADLAQAYDFARDKATALDRAAVVAWLRKEAVSHRRDGFPIAAYTMQERADAIERGEHHREEEE